MLRMNANWFGRNLNSATASILDLRRQLEQQAAEINRFKTLQTKLESDLASEKSVSSDSEQTTGRACGQAGGSAVKRSVSPAKAGFAGDSSLLRTPHRQPPFKIKVNDLTRLLQERQTTIDQQQELLARDRDIRELMGARDLYIAEVHDVAGTGTTSKPYGRVFYTKGKSLIFYAYDLDQQKAARNTSTFQVWGTSRFGLAACGSSWDFL